MERIKSARSSSLIAWGGGDIVGAGAARLRRIARARRGLTVGPQGVRQLGDLAFQQGTQGAVSRESASSRCQTPRASGRRPSLDHRQAGIVARAGAARILTQHLGQELARFVPTAPASIPIKVSARDKRASAFSGLAARADDRPGPRVEPPGAPFQMTQHQPGAIVRRVLCRRVLELGDGRRHLAAVFRGDGGRSAKGWLSIPGEPRTR